MIDVFVKVLLIMAVLLAFIIPGFLLKKFNFLDEKASVSLSNILLFVCQPALMIDAFCVFSTDNWQRISSIGTTKLLSNFGIVAMISLLAMLAVFAFSKLIFIKSKNSNKNIYTFIAIFSNCGFLGIPFVKMFTDGDPLAVMYVAVFNVIFVVLLWTLGVVLITGDAHEIKIKKIVCNPSIICTFIALLLFFVPQSNVFMIDELKDLQILPQYLSYMNAPLSMIIVGIRLASIRPKTLFCSGEIYVASLLRLFVAPLVTFGVALLAFLCFGQDVMDMGGEYVFLAPVVAMAMSPAASIVAISERYGADTNQATAAFLNGTLISVVVIPLTITAILSMWELLV